MRRLFLASMIIVLVGMQTRNPQITVMLAYAALCLKADRKGKIVLLITLVLIIIRLSLNIDVSKVKQGYVTEINASSFIVDNEIDHVLVYSEDVADIHPFDRIVIVGEVTPIEARTSGSTHEGGRKRTGLRERLRKKVPCVSVGIRSRISCFRAVSQRIIPLS
jgi:hypothetical protein